MMAEGHVGGQPVGGPTVGVTRRGMLKGAGAVGAGALAARALLLRSAARDSSAIQQALNIAITAESLAVTFYGVARKLNDDGKLDIKDLIPYVESVQCEEQAHYNFLDAAGATPLVTSFTIPEAAVKDKASFLGAVVGLETIFVSAYLTAARLMAQEGELQLVEIAYEIGAIEAQHLVLAKAASGAQPPNDRAFAQRIYDDLNQAVQALKEAGYIGGAGTKYDAPGPEDPVCRGIFGLVPETTQAATPAASPVASPAASPAAATPAP